MDVSKCRKCRKETDSDFCADCHYPGIEDDYAEFRALLEEGYRYIDAAVMSGWRGAEEFSRED